MVRLTIFRIFAAKLNKKAFTMMRGNRKTAFTLWLCMAWTMTAGAQQTVESIRMEYQGVHEMIARMMPNEDGETAWPPVYYDLQVLQNLPGTGLHKENIRMFYGELEPEEEGDPNPPHYLQFTTAKYNFAAREFYEEYLYDDRGQVMFIYARTPDVDSGFVVLYELRMWFDNGHLLRFTAKREEGKAFKEIYSGTTIPEMYQSETDRCRQRAQRFLTMFKGIDDNTYL